MKKILCIAFLIICFILGVSFFSHPQNKVEEFYADINGWPELFQYYPDRKIIKVADKSFQVKERTENSFSILTDEGVSLYYRFHFAEDEYELLSKSHLLNEKNKKVAVLTFAMGRDESDWKKFYEMAEKNFLARHQKKYFVFTDNNNLEVQDNVLKIAHYNTGNEDLNLKRFHIIEQMKNLLNGFDYIYFMDVNLLPDKVINEEIFPTKEQGLVSMIHPCYYKWTEDQFPQEMNINSNGYVVTKEQKFYLTNSFFGGTKAAFFDLTSKMKEWVDLDLEKLYTSKFGSESFLNKYFYSKIKEFEEPLVLMPEITFPNKSCMVEIEKKIDNNQIVILKNGIKTPYEYDEETKTLKGIDHNLSVLRRTKNTITIPSDMGVTVYHRVYYSINEYEPLTDSHLLGAKDKKVAVISFAMGDEAKNWNDFYRSVDKNFLSKQKKSYFVFTDKKNLKVNNKRVKKVYSNSIAVVLKRFHEISKIKKDLQSFDYIYFVDVMLRPLSPIEEEILPTADQSLAYVIHPWHYRWLLESLPYERNENSKAYIERGAGKFYVQNVFFGGTKEGFMNLMSQVMRWTDADIQENQIPKWLDESYLNKYLYETMKASKSPLILGLEYVYPEEWIDDSGEFEMHKKMILKKKANESD